LLTENRHYLETMVDALIKYETIDAGQIADIMAGREPGVPDGWKGDDGNDDGAAGDEEVKKSEAGERGGTGKPAGQL
jgi:cell division protease FtsH